MRILWYRLRYVTLCFLICAVNVNAVDWSVPYGVVFYNEKVNVGINNAAANGIDSNTVYAKVIDRYGKPVPNIMVIFSASNGASVTPTINPTGDDGMVVAKIVSLNSGVSAVRLSLSNGESVTVNVNFSSQFKSSTDE